MLLSKYKLPVIIIAALLVTGVLGFVASYQLTTNISNTAAAVEASDELKLGTKNNPNEVDLTRYREEPIDLLINTGEYVQFNSKDGGEHQVIQGKPTVEHGHDELSDATNGEDHGTVKSPLDSGIIKANEGYLVQFNNIGKYEFHDNYNHHYAITIIVYDKNKTLESTKLE